MTNNQKVKKRALMAEIKRRKSEIPFDVVGVGVDPESVCFYAHVMDEDTSSFWICICGEWEVDPEDAPRNIEHLIQSTKRIKQERTDSKLPTNFEQITSSPKALYDYVLKMWGCCPEYLDWLNSRAERVVQSND